jgi:hypothetical protein
MRKLLTILFVLSGIACHSQIKGKITSSTGEGIPFVSITVENTYTGTTANEDGQYELPIKAPGNYTLLFQSIGFKPKKVPLKADALPYMLNVVLEDENYELKELVISNSEDPAYAIIRQAIAHKEENGEKSGRFEADFYSKGMYRVKNLPKKIMGMKVEAPDEGLDSTGSGIIYLSETVSHITFQHPDKIKERIIATKVSGNSNGFSYNTARENNFNFYDDYLYFETDLVSPIAKGALGYYRYKFEGSFFDDNGNQINKIKVLPRRDKEPVFEGYIYIVDSSWAIYAVDLNIKGYRMRQPVIENLNLQQNFSYNQTNGIWAKNSQTLDFTAGLFGITFSGKYTYVYSNYIFHEKFGKETFGKEIAIIEKDFNKKEADYWTGMRPVPLTDDEVKDYIKKDSIQAVRKTQKDSITTKNNKFHFLDPVTGYNYHFQDSTKYVYFNYDGLISKPAYNTVQGWNLSSGLSFYLSDTKKKKYFSASAKFNYGFAEDRLRVSGSFSQRIGKLGTFFFSGGNTIEQFNPGEPISPLVNSISTLAFKDNYMKLYDNTFAKVSYGRVLFKTLSLSGNVEYLRRRPLYNNADWVFIKNDHDYTSNNPLEPYNYTSAPFVKHELMKATIGGRILFERDYVTYPTGKVPVFEDNNYPEISFQYQKAFAGSEKQYEYDLISAQASYKFTLHNKGDFGINLKAGKFFNADGIAFMDYKHFNGNQTHVGTAESYLNVFNLLPYYSHSTNDSYLETHIEHNFKGYIMNKIPLLNLLQWNLIAGFHNLATPDYKPYQEFTLGFDNIGIGAFRFLRVDYVRSYQGGFQTDGIILGLNFFLD